MNQDRKQCFDHARRVVVKVGSGVLTHENGLNVKIVRSLSRQICDLINQGKEVILVTSGAMASGLAKVGLTRRPDEIPQRQAVAAVGQAGLILEYEKAFGRHGRKVAQILLTSDGLSNRKRYLNARNTLYTLLGWNIVPIINENDTVSVDEIKFGDNDNLAAMITLLMEADLLVSLTDIDGLYTSDPRTDSNARLISVVEVIRKSIEISATGIPGALGTGGMLSKVKAARKVTAAGIPMVIASGKQPDILPRLFAGAQTGTFFVPKKERMTNRKCWIAFNLKPEGMINVDEGAANALVNNGKSLLPGGILSVEGEFGVGAAVQFKKAGDDAVLGAGLVNYSAADIRKIMGLRSDRIAFRIGSKPYDEVIHRNNMVIMDQCDI
ncbi:MAG: glutamate 5-kinase [Desulfobacterales bacterium]|nr:glutamate 5-kinase [Desulfobacterales bacterium]MDD3081189.1 glutamate 5-kinase [Desulfobacterales bacterium]MDD3950263.1 glutamate 5-kinase [Desulfobacterales bacterium]